MGIFEMFFSSPEKGKAPKEVTVFSEQELKKRLQEEGQISAIKLVREFSEIGLKEAKEFVDYFQLSGCIWEATARKFPSTADMLIPGSSDVSSSAPLADRSEVNAPHSDVEKLLASYQVHIAPEVKEQIRRMLKNDRLIDAIKRVREVTDLGLKEAKDIADAIKAEL
ncbi:MAG: ribosomal protein L7/L12 [Vulcanimicrobiota bacterium]